MSDKPEEVIADQLYELQRYLDHTIDVIISKKELFPDDIDFNMISKYENLSKRIDNDIQDLFDYDDCPF